MGSVTLKNFFQYIGPQTIVIDFGTWIGPTAMFASQLAHRVYGVEADPYAYAEVMTNIRLNPTFSDKIVLQPGCVGAVNGPVIMKTSNPGNSCSGIGEAIGCGVALKNWTVTCYTLPTLFKHWQIDLTSNVFIKIDVEGYECVLIPSLVEWFQSIEPKPTLHIAMHKSSVAACSATQYAVIGKLAKSYKYAACTGVLMDEARIDFEPCHTGELLLTDWLKPLL